jgi:hypothetical protein
LAAFREEFFDGDGTGKDGVSAHVGYSKSTLPQDLADGVFSAEEFCSQREGEGDGDGRSGDGNATLWAGDCVPNFRTTKWTGHDFSPPYLTKDFPSPLSENFDRLFIPLPPIPSPSYPNSPKPKTSHQD